MKWNVTYDLELNIIHSVFAGCVPVDAFRKGTVKVISLAKKYKTKAVLIDSSKLESSGSIVDIYELPQLYDELK